MDGNTRYVWGSIMAMLVVIGATILIQGRNLREADNRMNAELAGMQFRLGNEIAERRRNQTQMRDGMETNLHLLICNDSGLEARIDTAATSLSADDRNLREMIDIATTSLSAIINQTRTELLALADRVSLVEARLQGHVYTTGTIMQAINQTIRDNRQAVQDLAQKQLTDIRQLADNLTKALDSLNAKMVDTANAILDRLAQELVAVAEDTASLQTQINALDKGTQTLGNCITTLADWAKAQTDELLAATSELACCDQLLAEKITGLANVTVETSLQVEEISAQLANQDTAIDRIRQSLAAIWAGLANEAIPVEFYSCSGWEWNIDQRIRDATLFSTQTAIFSGQLVFSVQNLSHSILYSYNPATERLTVRQTAPLPGLFGCKTIGDKLYVMKLFASFPVYNGTIYTTTDFETWTVEASTDQCCLQSIVKYTPTGAIYAGGVYSTGEGTYTRIMKLSNGTLDVVWDGTVYGSDDGIEMSMFDSTQIVCIDAYRANAIYSIDPDSSWTDPWDATLFDWVRSVEIREDGNMWMAGYDDAPTGRSGLAKWDGKTHTSYVLNKTCWVVCNGSVGVSEGRERPPIGVDPEYPCSIYTYTTDGTLDRLTLQCNCRSLVGGMAYDPSRNRLFALFWIPPYGVFVLEGCPPT